MPNYTANTNGGTLRASNSNDTIVGSAVNDTLWGLGGDDIITGGNGDDIIEGDGAYTVADAVRETGTATISNSTVTIISLTPSLAAMGQLDSGASVWRIRNTSNAAMTVSFAPLLGGTAVTVTVPAHSDYFLTDTNTSTHKITFNGLIVDTKSSSNSSFTQTDAYGVTVDGNDILSGGAGNDTIRGYGGNDSLDGGIGNDTLDGGAGNDVLIGGAGADKLTGGDGVDVADYSASTAGVTVNLTTGTGVGGDAQGDTLATIENLIGSNFDDVLTGSAVANTLNGGLGNDVLAGGAVTDTLIGGAGVDRVDYSASTIGVTVNLATGSGVGGDADGDVLVGIENLTGSKLNDVLIGDAGANSLDGGLGDDKLIGGAGADVLVGGAGVDVADYSASAAGVTIDLTAGTGVGGDAQGDTLATIENITGSAFNDTVTGDANANTVNAGAGNDYVDGAAGNDVLYGGDGDDTLTGNYGTDKMYGEAGNDTFLAEWDEGNGDYYNGGEGADTYKIDGTIFQNYALQIDLTTGTDQYHDTFISVENLIGGSANDTFTGDAGVNQLWGRDGNDALDGRAGNDFLYGEGGDDTVVGGDGDDLLDGGVGVDTLDGGIGNDMLIGGAGADKLTGGAGIDTVDYSASTAGVTVNLTTGAATGGDAQGDTLATIENSIGSAFDDVLTGDAGVNTLDGGAGNDVLAGGAGADVLIGGAGVDMADYSAATAGVTVNLTSGTASDGDVLSGIENLKGSAFNDVLTGNASANVLDGGAGNDILAGGAAADTLIGGAGVDTADYAAATAGVTANLATGLASDGDTFSGIENLVGTAFDDVLNGDAGVNTLDGGAGNDVLAGGAGADVLIGGAGVDTADYSVATAGVTVSLATGVASDGDVLSSIENLKGSSFNDVLAGNAGANVLNGGAGVDTADYSTATAGVSVNLTTGLAADGDVLSNIENLKGSTFDDVLTGDAGVNTLDGGAGNDALVGGAGADVLIGGAGVDTADYSAANAGVTVNLATGTASDGDVLSGIENIKGSAFDDVLTGNAVANVLDGGAGNDVLAGAAAADILIGGSGVDTADYSLATAGVVASLGTGTASDGDMLSGIENLTGSAFNDVLAGDAGINILDGGAGNDVLVGSAGADTLVGGAGIDTADYSVATVGVIVNLATGTASDGDTLSDVENLIGSAFNDVLIGNAVANVLDGGAGDDLVAGGAAADTLIGGAGVDTVDYSASTISVSVNMATGAASDGDVLSGFENLKGSAFDDILTGDAGANVVDGGSGNDALAGGAGADTLIGGAGFDTADYSSAAVGVTVNIATGVASDGDTLSGIENLKGSGFNDTLIGNAGANVLDGGAGVDTADYSAATAGVTASLGTGTASDGDAFVSIENITGSAFNDELTGNAGANLLDGGAGDDLLFASAGSDTLIGGYGFDTVDYAFSNVGVTVNLTTGANSNGDTLVGIENINGTAFNDVLSGDAGANTLNGGAGNDILLGDAGADLLIGGDGLDVADYSTSNVGVYINLFTGENHGGDAEGDVLVGIENLKGTAFDDILIGSAETTILDGGAGNDILDYSHSLVGVSVNLTTNFAFGGFATGDVISNFENLRGSAAADDLEGTSGANQLFGGDGNDTLYGFAGMDMVYGGAGDDTIVGGADADTIDGGEGSDTVSYATSASAAIIDLLGNAVSGGDADGDVLVSIENAIGSDFDDLFVSSAAANVLNGGLGVDTLDYSGSTAAVIINLDSNSASGGYAQGDVITGFENLVGSSKDDQLTGSVLANVLNGGAGNDMLQGFAGDDTLVGGAGNDRLYGGAGADVLSGGDGVDTADYRYALAGVTVSLVSNTGTGDDAQGDTLSGIENLSGSNFDDVLTGDAGNNRLVGNEGSDKLYGGAGNDMFDTGGGYDFVDGGSGVDTVTYDDSWGLVVVNLATGKGSGAEAANDTYINVENVEGSAFNDILTGDAGVNRLNGLAGDDTLSGGAGNDILVGGAGADTLIGGDGDQDAASYQDAGAGVIANLALGGTGGEALGDTYSGVEYIYGSAFNDILTGDAAINRLTGGAGNDRLDGAAGNDYLLGEAGNDTLIGGAGADVFVFDKSFGNDTISDFWAGAGRTDRVWITNTDIHNFADVLSHSVYSGAGVVFTITGQDSITFTGITMAQLVADDFIFV